MKVVFDDNGWEDYLSWADTAKMLNRINRMINETMRNPGFGIGKPEQLSGNLSGYWSRRIDQEHRLIYPVHADQLVVIAARYHY